MNLQFKLSTCIYVITSLIILTITTAICSLCGIDKFFGSFVDISYFDLLTGQIANTLIVLSLTSVLSSDFGQAYWIDIKDTKLITPFDMLPSYRTMKYKSPIWGYFHVQKE